MNAKPTLPAWDDLHVFLATARSGTITRAGHALGVDASTVHRRLAKLEATLRTRLFDRSQTGYSLTSAGEELLEHVARIEQETLAIGRRIADHDEGLHGHVRLATVGDLACTLLPKIIGRFLERNPNVTVDVAVDEAATDLGRRHADVAVRLGAKPREADFVARHICRIGLMMYASKSYLDEHPRPRRLEDLARHRIVLGDDAFDRNPMELHVRRHTAGATVAFRSNAMLARLGAVRDGLGVGMLPRFTADRERSLVRLFAVQRPDLPADMWLVRHVDVRHVARVRAFAAFVYDALRAERHAIEGM